MPLTTYVPFKKIVPGGGYFSQVTITGPVSYTTGGDPIDATKLGLPANQLKGVIECRPGNLAACAFTPILPETPVTLGTVNGAIETIKLQFATAASATEVAAATDLHLTTWVITFIGN